MTRNELIDLLVKKYGASSRDIRVALEDLTENTEFCGDDFIPTALAFTIKTQKQLTPDRLLYMKRGEAYFKLLGACRRERKYYIIVLSMLGLIFGAMLFVLIFGGVS